MLFLFVLLEDCRLGEGAEPSRRNELEADVGLFGGPERQRQRPEVVGVAGGFGAVGVEADVSRRRNVALHAPQRRAHPPIPPQRRPPRPPPPSPARPPPPPPFFFSPAGKTPPGPPPPPLGGAQLLGQHGAEA